MGCLAQDESITRRYRFDVLLGERPTRLDWIEIGRVRRQIFDASVCTFDQLDDATIVMRFGVVEDDDVAAFELRDETFAHPLNEANGVGGFEDRSHRDPTREAHRADHREARSPIHRSRIDELFATTNPRV